MANIVITGATGFVGRSATPAVAAAGHGVLACVRQPVDLGIPGVKCLVVPDIASEALWSAKLTGASCVLHLAGSAHSNPRGDPVRQAEIRRVNVTGTERLARAAMAAGVSRFVFVSSIGVNGSHTRGKPFAEDDEPAPGDFYSATKWEAEQTLHHCCAGSSVELVVVRPTLVAGAGAPGNLDRLVRLIQRGLPIPYVDGETCRNLVGVRSLADLLVLACVHPAAAGRTFLAAEDPPLSVADIAIEIASGLNRRARLLKLPRRPLKSLAALAGRSRDFARIGESLRVDAAAARRSLGWSPHLPIQSELRQVGAAMRRSAAGP